MSATPPVAPAHFAVIAAAFLVALGTCIMIGWGFDGSTLLRVGIEGPSMAFGTAASFALAGGAVLARLSSRRPGHIAAVACAGCVAVIAVHAVGENGGSLRVGPDPLLAWIAGRSADGMSTPTALAFLAGTAAIIASVWVRTKGVAIAIEITTAAVGLMGTVVVAGWLVGARLLYTRYVFEDVALHTGAGLAVFAAGLWLTWERQAWFVPIALSREDDRIAFHGASILGAIALICGIASYGTLQRRVQADALDDVGVDMREREEQVRDALTVRATIPRIAAERPALLRYLVSEPRQARDLADVLAGIASLKRNGFSAVEYRDAQGAVIAGEGAFVAAPDLIVPVGGPVRSHLMWSSGRFVLRHIVPVRFEGRVVGQLLAEQPLPVLTRFVQARLDLGESEEIVICASDAITIDCFPSQLHPAIRHSGVRSTGGQPRRMAMALARLSGTTIARDSRGHQVFEAYGPIGDTGLGMILKVDSADLLHSLREELHVAVVLLGLLVAAGTVLLRWKVRPLATRLLEAQHEAQQRNSQLVDAIEAKDRFVATMSHELRTPLNAIIGFTGMLLLKLPGPLNAEQERQLGTVRSSARYLLSLINDLLDLAKIEAGRIAPDIEPVSCQQLVEEVVESLRPLAEAKGLALNADMPEASVMVQSDRRLLSQILLNLAGNAIKFTEAGHVAIRVRQEEHRVEFSVADTGPGIAHEDHGKLFSAFTQLDSEMSRRHEGTGLGLHLSRRFAEVLGGQIILQSAVGAGSTFTLVLQEA